MLIHVVSEVTKKGDLLVECLRVVAQLVVVFLSISLNVMNVSARRGQNLNNLGEILNCANTDQKIEIFSRGKK